MYYLYVLAVTIVYAARSSQSSTTGKKHVPSTTGSMKKHSTIFLTSHSSKTSHQFPPPTPRTSTSDVSPCYSHRGHCARYMYERPVHKKAPRASLTYTSTTTRHKRSIMHPHIQSQETQNAPIPERKIRNRHIR